ncbi:hypothetical protein, partial [Serratia marcescens]|uniref:hypothetical protein n=1 Tax=Serratia marcescens TaxID=615 RepID=UPI002812D396
MGRIVTQGISVPISASLGILVSNPVIPVAVVQNSMEDIQQVSDTALPMNAPIIPPTETDPRDEVMAPTAIEIEEERHEEED